MLHNFDLSRRAVDLVHMLHVVELIFSQSYCNFIGKDGVDDFVGF
jgi:hypothetical protein